MDNIVITAILRAKKGHENDLLKAMKQVVSPSQKESGCITYQLHQSRDEDGVFVIYEIWQDEESLQQHIASDHYKAYRLEAEAYAESREVHRLKVV
ncbi:putative quinol monooxygenase [Fictibacillus iocasae]|uniref:Quinol monooxygenase n=1 Tax=Fictibacillus iocasae TaxID=2715437 RepID=A0ABW2NQS3_9BACL